eukprot:gb/GFBE01065979.1/.p1 GENE.gb/GFBE01065979.1/~~gb/GFBE01065979.1/.p1  ORF type:complete len:154 (+),score=15.48 gb/GFBE01065979.1/:1-462(+)
MRHRPEDRGNRADRNCCGDSHVGFTLVPRAWPKWMVFMITVQSLRTVCCIVNRSARADRVVEEDVHAETSFGQWSLMSCQKKRTQSRSGGGHLRVRRRLGNETLQSSRKRLREMGAECKIDKCHTCQEEDTVFGKSSQALSQARHFESDFCRG